MVPDLFLPVLMVLFTVLRYSAFYVKASTNIQPTLWSLLPETDCEGSTISELIDENETIVIKATSRCLSQYV